MRMRNRTAEVAARIVIVGVASRHPLIIVLPVIGIQNVIAGIEVSLAMIIRGARFADGADHDGAILPIRAKVRSLYADFLGHLWADDGDRTRGIPRIEHINAIGEQRRASAVGGAVQVDAITNRTLIR